VPRTFVQWTVCRTNEHVERDGFIATRDDVTLHMAAAAYRCGLRSALQTPFRLPVAVRRNLEHTSSFVFGAQLHAFQTAHAAALAYLGPRASCSFVTALLQRLLPVCVFHADIAALSSVCGLRVGIPPASAPVARHSRHLCELAYVAIASDSDTIFK
jgi:hypothetical protein